jgi:hypothetical protein
MEFKRKTVDLKLKGYNPESLSDFIAIYEKSSGN